MEEDIKKTIKENEVKDAVDSSVESVKDNKEGENVSTKMRRKTNYTRSRRSRKTGARADFEKRTLSVRRVARVVDGGRRFSLSVAVVVGDRNGKVGIGIGKGPDMAIAMEKATNKASKNMIKINLTDEGTISSDVSAKYCASIVSLRPSKSFVAGGAVRSVAELVGIKNLNAKILSRSKSAINNARATLKALSSL